MYTTEYILQSHNPYFNRWFSAIQHIFHEITQKDGHNPYFNRWFSAINKACSEWEYMGNVTILILIDGFLQFKIAKKWLDTDVLSQSLF